MNSLTYPTLTDRTFGVELEFVGISPRTVAETINNVDGIECYFEGYHHNTRPYWKIVTDASLDGVGGELVSPILKGVEGALQLEKILTALDDLDGIGVDIQCGMHVHLDVNDLTVRQIQNAYERYADYESQIDMIMPRSRRGNGSRWCASIENNKRYIKRANTKMRLASTVGRYYKVNLQSLARYGTMEFRQHSGTLNFEKIINWVSFLQAFVEKSAKLATATRRVSNSRAFGKIRNAVENAGYEIRWNSSLKGWDIVDYDTNNIIRFENHTLTALYDGARETNINLERLKDFMVVHGLITSLQTINVNTPNTTTQEVDGGWLDGADNKVKTFYQERQLELN